ncbi:T9SS type A sorting domain-containing protein [Sporocytophaga myxococcoides]|uniref:T9SS type A sorting domain-containing protein n=1 Tax=Sporocytophaga myxococcoides TaxID=153721 RepID=UPI0005EF3C2F|nr:T9SS type A sorting domain-containing protein [Sporocytophaga myxococcoides]
MKKFLFLLFIIGAVQKVSFALVTLSDPTPPPPTLSLSLNQSSGCIHNGNSKVTVSFSIANKESGKEYEAIIHYVSNGNDIVVQKLGSGNCDHWTSQSGYFYGELVIKNTATPILHTTGHYDYTVNLVEKPNLQKNYYDVCVGIGNDITFDITITNASNKVDYSLQGGSSGSTFTYVGNGGNPNNAVYSYKGKTTVDDNTDIKFKVIAKSKADPSCDIESDEITAKVHRPQTLQEIGGSYTIYLSSPTPKKLKELFVNLPSNVNLTFDTKKAKKYVYKNSSNEYVFDPSVAAPYTGSFKDSIVYTVDYGTCGKVTNIDLKTEIIIVNDKESLPSFLKSVEPLPICNNSENFSFIALIKDECQDPDPWLPTISVIADNGTFPAKDIKSEGRDDLTGAYRYRFTIEPHKYKVSNNGVVKVEISSICDLKILPIIDYMPYRTDLTLTVPPKTFISGFPSEVNGIVSLCSSSSDTISIRGIPSGSSGKYVIEKGISLGGNNYKFEPTEPTALRYAGFASPESDPTLERFVPAQVFNNVISSKYDSVIRITYWSPKPCSDSTSIILKFLPPADIKFTYPNDTICFGDELMLNVKGKINIGDNFLWKFGDGGSLSSPDSNLSYVYERPGRYFLRFQTNIKDLNEVEMCNNDIIDTIYVGAKPTASFDIYNNYLGESVRLESNSKILVPNTPEAKDTIFAWNWKFSGGLTDLQGDSVSFGSPGVEIDPYQVLHITTASWGCSDTAILSMPIFPVHTVSPDEFDKEQFNTSSKNGWYHTGQYYNDETLSSWRNVPPNGAHIKAISPGDAAWFTSVSGKGGYNAGEKSWVESPVYEIGNLQLPMLSMDTWTDMNYPFDGASVQFAFVDTTAFGKEKWQTLGEMDGEGLNWYNFNSVSGKPGNEEQGWTDNKSGRWSLSAYRLDTILKLSAQDPVNRKRVRFRIVLGTTTIGQNMDGFAFDNFFVGQRNRKIIVEEFCDHENKIENPDELFIDPQALRVQYHLADLVDDDEINIQNPYEPSARALLYGIGKTLPRIVLDGIFFENDKAFGTEYVKWSQKSLLERSLITSPYNIKLNSNNNGDSLKIEATIEKSSTVTEDKNYVVQVAIIEKVVQGNGKEFTNVLRKMLPNSAGHRIDKNSVWTSTTINTSWKPTIKPTSDIYIMAYLQDEDTKEIYQSDYLPVALADYQNLYSGARPGSPSAKGSFSDLTLSPNPTSHDLMVRFDGVLKDDYTWSIIDVLGNQRNAGLMLYGTEAKILSTEQLGTGMYYLKLEGEGRSFIKKFSVVK